jgi:hypothetical protein
LPSDGFDREVEQDDTVVYATMTIHAAGSVSDDKLAEMFPDADYLKADHRVTGDILAEIGDKPTTFVCPECGEGVDSKRDIDDTPYYRHYDNKDCERDMRDALKQKREERQKQNRTPRWKQALGLAIGAGISLSGFVAVMRFLATREMTMNNEPVMIPPPGPGAYISFGLLLVLAIAIFLTIQVLPRPGPRGGLR